MVALVRPSEKLRKDMPPRYAALLEERELELQILAHMLSQATAYREAEILGLTPADFIQSSIAGTRAIREPDQTGYEVERSVDTVADHAILAEAIALSRSERINVHDAIEEVCHIRLAKTRNQIDRYRIEIQRQSVPALIDKARGAATLTTEEFQRRVRSLRRLRDALAEEEEKLAVIDGPAKTKGSRSRSKQKAKKQNKSVSVTPLRRADASKTDSPYESADVATEFDPKEPVTVTTTIFNPANPDRPMLFHRTVIDQGQHETTSLPIDDESRIFKKTEVRQDIPQDDAQPFNIDTDFHLFDEVEASSFSTQPPDQVLQKAAPQYQQPILGAPARLISTPGLPLDTVEPLSNFANALSQQILTPSAQGIPTPSAALNEAFSGGWSRGRLYLMAGPPESGKTTFCAWAADHAARNQIPVVFVTFELGKSQLWLHGIARTARLDSRAIESQPWQGNRAELSGHLRKQVQNAINSYSQLAKHLNVIEARPGISCFDLRPAIMRIREHYKLAGDAPVLVVIDSISSLTTGMPEIDFGKDTAVKTEQVVASLKQLARETNSAVLAITATGANVTAMMNATGEVTQDALRQEPWCRSAADTIMLLASNEISGSDQLQLLINRYRENQGVLVRLRRLREDSPSDPAGLERSTYTRLSVLKNRGGVRSELLFLYQRAFHNFIPFDLLLELSR